MPEPAAELRPTSEPEARVAFSTLFKEDAKAQEKKPPLLREIPVYDVSFFLENWQGEEKKGSISSEVLYPQRDNRGRIFFHIHLDGEPDVMVEFIDYTDNQGQPSISEFATQIDDMPDARRDSVSKTVLSIAGGQALGHRIDPDHIPGVSGILSYKGTPIGLIRPYLEGPGYALDDEFFELLTGKTMQDEGGRAVLNAYHELKGINMLDKFGVSILNANIHLINPFSRAIWTKDGPKFIDAFIPYDTLIQMDSDGLTDERIIVPVEEVDNSLPSGKFNTLSDLLAHLSSHVAQQPLSVEDVVSGKASIADKRGIMRSRAILSLCNLLSKFQQPGQENPITNPNISCEIHDDGTCDISINPDGKPDRRKAMLILPASSESIIYQEGKQDSEAPDLEVSIDPNTKNDAKITYDFIIDDGLMTPDGMYTDRIIFIPETGELTYRTLSLTNPKPDLNSGQMVPSYIYEKSPDLTTKVNQGKHLPYEYERFNNKFGINPASNFQEVREHIAGRIVQLASSKKLP